MRVAQIQTETGHGVVAMDLDHRVKALLAGTIGVHDAPVPKVDCDEVALEMDELDAPPSGDRELVGGLQALTTQVCREHPSPVATHLGRAAVGVAIVHEPPGPGTLIAHVLFGSSLRRDHSDHAVCSDAGPAIGDLPHLLSRHIVGAIEIGHQHEVVLGAVALGESQLAHVSHLGHCPSRPPPNMPPSSRRLPHAALITSS